MDILQLAIENPATTVMLMMVPAVILQVFAKYQTYKKYKRLWYPNIGDYISGWNKQSKVVKGRVVETKVAHVVILCEPDNWAIVNRMEIFYVEKKDMAKIVKELENL